MRVNERLKVAERSPADRSFHSHKIWRKLRRHILRTPSGLLFPR